MARKIRIILAVGLLVFSLTLLIWGLWPEEHKTIVVPVEPTQMQLPTPSASFLDFELPEFFL